ncbi:alpha/beta fold hydrolase [Ilumatobacter nonamiensis]|uniref:alpha/beta fold hydrolase n=1 Tax=Ilumatobacter nonamiensis TaxID=467093 RepID=UPI0003487ECE|nr:alpha/beta hydrolase [Ilumatobacter nonamiensis]
MAFADVNGQRLFYEDSGGDGPVVVFSHGFLMDHSMFDPQVEILRETHRVVTWDERGFGQTEFDGKPFSYWDSASDCLGLMDHLGVDRAVLAGMSQGGFLSLRAALTAPERVAALILLDTQAGGEDPAVQEGYRAMIDTWVGVGPVDELAGTIADIIIADPELNEQWIAKWRELPKEQMREPGECLLNRDDITDRLGEITCPALVVHGTEDTAITMDRAEALAAGLSGAGDVVRVPGAHAANLTHPGPVNDAIVAFLAGLA